MEHDTQAKTAVQQELEEGNEGQWVGEQASDELDDEEAWMSRR